MPDRDEEAGSPASAAAGSADRLSGEEVAASLVAAGSGLGLSVYCLNLSARSPAEETGGGGCGE